MDCSPPGFSVHGIFQARAPEWVAIAFSWGIFPTQAVNLSLWHCRQTLDRLSLQGSPGLIKGLSKAPGSCGKEGTFKGIHPGTPSKRSLDLDGGTGLQTFGRTVLPILVKMPQDRGLMDPGQMVVICPSAIPDIPKI